MDEGDELMASLIKNLTGKKLAAEENVRALRSLESSKANVEQQLKTAKLKLKQSEADLAAAAVREKLLLAVQSPPKPRTFENVSSHSKGTASAIICWTDWHVEETVKSSTVNGLNSFNLNIADKRIARTVNKSIELTQFARSLSKIDDLVIWLGGDFITGYIHEELMEGNSLSPPEAINWIQDRIFNGLRSIIKELKPARMRVVCNHGNHSRTSLKKRIATRAANSFEWMAYKTMEKFCQLDQLPIEWHIADGYHEYLPVQGKVVRFHHGDALKYGGGVGGITIPVNKAIAQWNKAKHADLDVFGHWHQYIEQWSWVSVGCLIGHSPFAIEIKADYQPPTQAIVVVDKHYGKVLSMRVLCEEKPVNVA